MYLRGPVDDWCGLFGCQVVRSAGGGVWTCDWVGELWVDWRRAAVLVQGWGLVIDGIPVEKRGGLVDLVDFRILYCN